MAVMSCPAANAPNMLVMFIAKVRAEKYFARMRAGIRWPTKAVQDADVNEVNTTRATSSPIARLTAEMPRCTNGTSASNNKPRRATTLGRTIWVLYWPLRSATVAPGNGAIAVAIWVMVLRKPIWVLLAFSANKNRLV